MGAACPSGRREPRSHSCRDPGQSASSVGLGKPAVGLGVAQGKARGGPSAVNSLWVAPGTARKVAPPRPGAPPPKCGASLQVPAGRRGCPPIRRWGGRRPRAWFVPGAHLPARPRSPETPGSEAAVSMPAAQGGTEARGAVRLPAATRFRRCGWALIEVSFLEILAASRCKERPWERRWAWQRGGSIRHQHPGTRWPAGTLQGPRRWPPRDLPPQWTPSVPRAAHLC